MFSLFVNKVCYFFCYFQNMQKSFFVFHNTSNPFEKHIDAWVHEFSKCKINVLSLLCTCYICWIIPANWYSLFMLFLLVVHILEKELISLICYILGNLLVLASSVSLNKSENMWKISIENRVNIWVLTSTNISI